VVEQASHQWLFPRVAAVVHHGGAGTTAAGLQAGRPSIVCPFQGDQYFWGKAVREIGAGPQPVPAKKLTAERLTGAIRAALDDPAVGTRATEISDHLAREAGTERASEEIEASLAGSSS
jgi:UDP:flavonoid glycosyltransferase YjiC (YdhE family)